MKRRISFSLYAVLMLLVLTLTGCGDDYDGEYDSEYEENYDEEYGNDDYNEEETEAPINTNSNSSNYSLGTCSELDGTTLLVSIFLNDANTSWENNPSAINDALKYTGIATEWISKSVAGYGRNIDFIYDWNTYSDLYYEATVDNDMVNVENDSYQVDSTAWSYIAANIDSDSLVQKYNADNIGFLFYINTPDSNDMTSCTRNYYEGMDYPYEMCYIYMFCDNEEESPASIAHEILHLFGAPDLYSADSDGENYGIPQELVDELQNTQSNDIMFTTYDAKTETPYYDKISNDFTEVDAYYVGLVDSCDFVNEWNLKPSQHN